MPTLTKKICLINSCENEIHARGYCGTHYTRLRKWGSADKLTRFDHPKHCSESSCDGVYYAKGLCRNHHQKDFYLRHSMYTTWQGMIARCMNVNATNYKNYGGRGIAVCERWLDYNNFFEDMGSKPEGTTLDRIDVNGDYEPSNCRWATDEQQRNNKRR